MQIQLQNTIYDDILVLERYRWWIFQAAADNDHS